MVDYQQVVHHGVAEDVLSLAQWGRQAVRQAEARAFVAEGLLLAADAPVALQQQVLMHQDAAVDPLAAAGVRQEARVELMRSQV